MNERARLPGLRRRTLIRDQVFARLVDDIVSGRMQPQEGIHDADLQAEYGVSRTPIREALIRLADLGLVELSSNRYTRVTPIDAGLQMERTETAHVLVARAAMQLAVGGAPEQLAEVKHLMDVLRSIHPMAFTESGGLMLWFDLFDCIIRLAGNTVTYSLFQGHLRLHLLRSLQRADIPPEIVNQLPDYLDELYGAFESGNGLLARDVATDAFADTVSGPIRTEAGGQHEI